MMKENETAAKLLTLHDCVWQLGNTLRDIMNRMETIQEYNKIDLEREIQQAKHTLERYAKGPMFYKPHPFGMKYDSCVKKDQLAGFPPTENEIKVGPASPLKTLLAATVILASGDGIGMMLEDGECEECEGSGTRSFYENDHLVPCVDCNGTGKIPIDNRPDET